MPLWVEALDHSVVNFTETAVSWGSRRRSGEVTPSLELGAIGDRRPIASSF
jgi:hypothetical protein